MPAQKSVVWIIDRPGMTSQMFRINLRQKIIKIIKCVLELSHMNMSQAT